jgi:uncharacterized protein (DUF4415 family)
MAIRFTSTVDRDKATKKAVKRLKAVEATPVIPLQPLGRPPSGKAREVLSLRVAPETLANMKKLGPDWRTIVAAYLDREYS